MMLFCIGLILVLLKWGMDELFIHRRPQRRVSRQRPPWPSAPVARGGWSGGDDEEDGEGEVEL